MNDDERTGFRRYSVVIGLQRSEASQHDPTH